MVTLAQKVSYFSNPLSYPHKPAAVEVIETHMSWVFLAGDLVYKFKKPVRLPFLDFTSLDARKTNCAEELRLNKRLAKNTYNRLVPLVQTSSGDLCFDGEGTIVEWLVEMNRLSSDATLEIQIKQGSLNRKDSDAIAQLLAKFYQTATPQIADGHLYLQHLSTEQAVSRKILTREKFGLADDTTLAIIGAVEDRFDAVRSEIEARIQQGFIIEGHGDLRPEHIYLSTPIQIIDCLEFNRSMRILDPYDEVNYLGMECQFIGAEWIRPVLLETLDAHLNARPSIELMQFYTAFRAVLRARICIAHLLDDQPMTPEIWPKRTRAYLELARVACFNSRPAKVD